MKRVGSGLVALGVGLVALACAAALVYTSGSRADAALQDDLYVWTPHEGQLTSMINNAKPVQRSQAREQQLAITDSITDRAASQPAAHQSASSRSASAWAKQMLSLGGSFAEDKSRSHLVGSHSGYTTEGHRRGGVYAFANQITHGEHSRRETQVGPARTQVLEETAVPSHSHSSHMVTAVKQVAQPGATPDVREDHARGTTKAADRQHGAAGISLAARKANPSKSSATFSESADTAEQKAWSWGSSAFSDGNRHRAFDATQARKDAAYAAATAAVTKRPTLADFAVPARRTQQESARSNESPRRARLAEARHAIVKLHRASLNFEHSHFKLGQRQESRRARELTRKDDDLERAANQGAAAEFNEYGAVASLGVPNGANSAAETEGDGWGRSSQQVDKARLEDFRSRDPGQRRRPARHREHGDEAQDVQQDTDYIFSGLGAHDHDRRDDRRARQGRRGRGGRRGVTQTAAQIASAEESSYQSGFDAGIAAEQKAMHEGGMESKAKQRVQAVQRQHARLKAQKAAQIVAQKKAARTQDLSDNTWGVDSDFQVDGDYGPGGGDWA